MPRAKAVAAKPAAVSAEPQPVPAPVRDTAFIPMARSIETVIAERRAKGQLDALPPTAPAAPVMEPSPEEVRGSFRSFGKRVIDARDAEYIHPEERSNRDNLAAIEAANMKKSRQAFGVDLNTKVVFPSPNMGRRAVEHKW